jgi:hypothetical protein
MFTSYPTHMNLYLSTILDLCKDTQEAYPEKFGTIYDDAIAMYLDNFEFNYI